MYDGADGYSLIFEGMTNSLNSEEYM